MGMFKFAKRSGTPSSRRSRHSASGYDEYEDGSFLDDAVSRPILKKKKNKAKFRRLRDEGMVDPPEYVAPKFSHVPHPVKNDSSDKTKTDTDFDTVSLKISKTFTDESNSSESANEKARNVAVVKPETSKSAKPTAASSKRLKKHKEVTAKLSKTFTDESESDASEIVMSFSKRTATGATNRSQFAASHIGRSSSEEEPSHTDHENEATSLSTKESFYQLDSVSSRDQDLFSSHTNSFDESDQLQNNKIESNEGLLDSQGGQSKNCLERRLSQSVKLSKKVVLGKKQEKADAKKSAYSELLSPPFKGEGESFTRDNYQDDFFAQSFNEPKLQLAGEQFDPFGTSVSVQDLFAPQVVSADSSSLSEKDDGFSQIKSKPRQKKTKKAPKTIEKDDNAFFETDPFFQEPFDDVSRANEEDEQTTVVGKDTRVANDHRLSSDTFSTAPFAGLANVKPKTTKRVDSFGGDSFTMNVTFSEEDYSEAPSSKDDPFKIIMESKEFLYTMNEASSCEESLDGSALATEEEEESSPKKTEPNGVSEKVRVPSSHQPVATVSQRAPEDFSNKWSLDRKERKVISYGGQTIEVSSGSDLSSNIRSYPSTSKDGLSYSSSESSSEYMAYRSTGQKVRQSGTDSTLGSGYFRQQDSDRNGRSSQASSDYMDYLPTKQEVQKRSASPVTRTSDSYYRRSISSQASGKKQHRATNKPRDSILSASSRNSSFAPVRANTAVHHRTSHNGIHHSSSNGAVRGDSRRKSKQPLSPPRPTGLPPNSIVASMLFRTIDEDAHEDDLHQHRDDEMDHRRTQGHGKRQQITNMATHTKTCNIVDDEYFREVARPVPSRRISSSSSKVSANTVPKDIHAFDCGNSSVSSVTDAASHFDEWRKQSTNLLALINQRSTDDMARAMRANSQRSLYEA